MNQLQTWAVPVASAAFALLWTPVNEGAMSYGLTALLAIALFGAMIGFEKSRHAQREATQQNGLARTEQLSELIATQQQTIGQLEETVRALASQSEAFATWKKETNAAQTARDEREGQYRAEMKRTVEGHVARLVTTMESVDQSIVTKLDTVGEALGAAMKKDHTSLVQKIDTFQQAMNTLHHERQTADEAAHNEVKRALNEMIDAQEMQQEDSKEREAARVVHFDQQMEQFVTNYFDPLLTTTNSIRKEVSRSLVDLLDGQKDGLEAVQQSVEDGAEDLHDLVEEKYEQAALYTEQMTESVAQLEQLTNVLDEQYVPLIEGIYDSAEALQDTATQLSTSIDEIASSKMKEREHALNEQKRLLQSLK